MQDLTLVILAAGMSKRFGGDKQIAPIGPNGEFIIDYSINDAIAAGFNKIILVIKSEHYDILKKTLSNRLKDKINLIYVFQRLEDIPANIKIPSCRTKLWGNAQALLAAEPYIKGNFAVINADDFYGKTAFLELANFLKNNKKTNEYISINYPLSTTLSKDGQVKRGLCQIKNNYITDFEECVVSVDNQRLICTVCNNNQVYFVDKNQLAMMNMFGLKYDFFKYLKEDFTKFINDHLNLDCEYSLNSCLKKLLLLGKIKIYSITSQENWFGLTYKNDLLIAQEKINKLIANGVYKANLWED